ncbi:MAG TPA: glycosyltransferase N-terminal domain-containing protein [bacterium]|nr:glycosyltransferase N-terminal domain-containing protein [bacterium]
MFYFLIYDFVFFIVLTLFFPFIWKKIRTEKDYPGTWKERFAIYRNNLKRGKRKRVWLHTVSVGEFLSITPLIEKLKDIDIDIIVSLTTKTGRKVAISKTPELKYIFFPFDFYPIMFKAISFLKPDIIVIVETEIWVNLIRISKRKNIPVVMINGRLSPKSFRRYKKLKFLTKRILPHFEKIAMRSESEKRKIISLGAKKEKIRICGSMKFDLAYQMGQTINSDEFKKSLNLGIDKKIIVFGSIHPEEEEEICKISKEIIENYPEWDVIIAPRFLDRSKIFNVLTEMKLPYVKRTEIRENFRILVVDTYGELNNFYSICEFAFVGGSLNRWGGQNPIEPIAFKKVVIYGKDNWHFFIEWEKIKKGGGGIEVNDFKQLKEKVLFLIKNENIRKKMGEVAYKILLQNTGATDINFDIIKETLGI